MLKAGVYGGVGAAIGVLAIVILGVGLLLFRAKRQTKVRKEAFDNEQFEKWYEGDTDGWDEPQGFINTRFNDENNDDLKNDALKENFKPSLENIDTRIQVKIQRPNISSV